MHVRKLFGAYLLIPLVSFIFSFLFLFSIDTQTTLGASQALQITKPSETPNLDAFRTELFEQAKKRKINIAKISSDTDNPVSGQILSLYIGNESLPSSQWVTRGYPTFNTSQEISMTHLEETLEDPVGIYLIYGDGRAANGLLTDIQQKTGYGGSHIDLYSISNIIRSLGSTPLMSAYIGSLFIVVAALCSTVILDSKTYARQRLFGAGYLITGTQEIKACTLASLLAACGFCLPAYVTLYIYNHLAFGALYTQLVLILFFCQWLLCVFFHLLSIGAVFTVSVSNSLKGKLPVSATYLASNALRLFTIFMTINALFAIGNAATQVSQAQRAERFWAVNSGVNYIDTVGFFATSADQQIFSDWIAEEIKEDNLIVAAAHSTGGLTDEEPVLVVNEKYLQLNAELIQGLSEVHTKINRDNINIFIPDHSSVNVEEISGALPYELSGEKISADSVFSYPAQQDVFTYGYSNQDYPATINSPILIYLPQEQLITVRDTLGAWSTTGGVLLEDRATALHRLESSTARHQVANIKNAREQQAVYVRENQNSIILGTYSVIVFVALLIFSSFGYFATLAREKGQNIFRYTVFGWHPVRIWKRYLVFEILLLAAIVYILYENISATAALSFTTSLPHSALTEILKLHITCSVLALALYLALTFFSIRTNHRREISRRARLD